MDYRTKRRRAAIKEMNALISKLLTNVDTYFDSNLVLNSEGMKVLSKLVKILIQFYPEFKPLVTKVRNNPSYESLLNLISKIREIENYNFVYTAGDFNEF